LAGRLARTPQNLSQQLYYSKDSIDFQRDSLVDWDQPAHEIQRRICAFSFEPFQLPITGVLLGTAPPFRTTVSNTEVVVRSSGCFLPGDIVDGLDDGSVLVKTGSAALIRVRKLEKQRALDFISGRGASWAKARFVRASLG